MHARHLLSYVLLSAALVGPAHAAQTNPAAASRYYEDGLARYERKDIPGAVIQLKNAIKEDGSMLAARVLLARALMEQGEYIAAETAYRDARRKGISLAEIAVPLGRLNLALGRPQVVLDTIPAAGLPLPVQVDVLTLHGAAYGDLGKVDEGLGAIALAKGLDPAAAGPLVTEATILLAVGRMSAARAAANRALELGPRNAGAWNVSASIWHATGALETALKEYSQAIEYEPAFADARVARAAILVDIKRDDDAQKDLEALETHGASDPRAAYLRSVLAARKGDSKAVTESLMEVQRLVDALPREWLVSREQFLMLGALANHGLGKRENSLTYLDTLINRYPRNLGARKLMASIYLDQRDYARALTMLEPVLRDQPNDANALYLAGRAHLARQRYDKAAQLLERAAQLSGDNPDFRKSLGQSQVGQGQSELGIQNLEKAFTAQPGDAAAGFLLATLYMQQGNPQRALALVQGLAERDPDNVAVLNFLGALKAAANDPPGAREAYGKALRRDPEFLPARLNLARVDVAEGKADEARRTLQGILAKRREHPDVLYELGLLEQSQRHYQEAQAAFAKALEKDPASLRAAMALIELHLQMGQPAQALDLAKAAALRNPGNLMVLEVLARTQLAQGERKRAAQTYGEMTKLAEYEAPAQVHIGRLNLQAGNLDAADYNAMKALTAKPDFAPARLLQGDVAVARGQHKEAEAIANRLRANPETALDGLRLAMNAAAAGKRYPEAITLARELVKRDRRSANIVALAEIQMASGDARGATAGLTTWTEENPRDVTARMVLADFYTRGQHWQAARVQYEKLRAQTADDPRILNNLALVLLRLGDPSALTVAREAVRLAPEDAMLTDTLGWVLVRSGDLDQGLRYLRDARLRLPENPEIRWHLGYALAKAGRKQEARDELDVALRTEGSFDGGDEARQLRQSL